MGEISVLGLRAVFGKGRTTAASSARPWSQRRPAITIQIFELGEISLYNQDVEDAGEPAPVVAFKEAIRQADASSSRPPSTTTACPRPEERHRLGVAPTCDRPLKDKPVAVLGASTGHGRPPGLGPCRDFVFTGACEMRTRSC